MEAHLFNRNYRILHEGMAFVLGTTPIASQPRAPEKLFQQAKQQRGGCQLS